MGKRKSKALLLAVALLIMALGMGSVVYAQNYDSVEVEALNLKQGDVIKKGCTLKTEFKYIYCYVNDVEVTVTPSGSYTLEEDLKVTKTEGETDTTNIPGGNPYVTGYNGFKIYLESYTPDSGSTTDTSSTSEDKSESKPVDPVQAWKASNANPENYLPKTTLADGTTVQSTVASHFAGNASAAVIVTTPEGDFNKALGISGGYAHLMGTVSQCGEQLKAAFADYAKVLGENLGAELTLGDIFDLKTEVREKGTYKLLDTVKESSEPVTLSRGLQGEMLKAAKAGCDFAVICYTDGKAVLCKDVDTEVSTITINTTITSGTYAIIYGPKGCFDGLE